MKNINIIYFLGLLILCNSCVLAQGNSEKQGTQAWMKGDFKSAVVYLEKAESSNPKNINVLKMLGYSYFQCADFEHAIEAYSKLLVLKPDEYTAYYYRGKAYLNIANSPKESNNPERDQNYSLSIEDFTRAMQLNGEDDIQILQNRGIAYKDYAIYKSYKIKKRVDKNACIAMFNSAIGDFQKILNLQPLRKDVASLIDYVKAQITSLK